jgi:phosphodiesterase/alkaline phosphatase D-like protein
MRKLRTPLLLAVVAGAIAVVTAETAPALSTVPQATTGQAKDVNQSGAKLAATLIGALNPEGQATRYHFEYGTTAKYGSTTASVSLPAGSASVPVNATVTSLSASSSYHFRLVAVNASGTRFGGDETFKPLTTGQASAVSQDSAILNGALNALGQPTSYYFEFGTTPLAYGAHTSPATASANANVGVYAQIAGLQPNSVYHYRIAAQSAGSTYYGVDRTLKTSGPAQSRIGLMGRMGFVSPGGGRWIGVELGCFNGQTSCSGHITMSHDGTVVGQRNFAIAPESGGFQNIQLSQAGGQLLRGNTVHHLLPVHVTVAGTDGQTISYVMDLARWVWR